MSPDYDAWFGESTITVGTPAERAARAWLRIQDKPVAVTFITQAGLTLAAQTVRLEISDSGESETEGETASLGLQDIVVFGIEGHETLPDTDMERGYRFFHEGVLYEIGTTIHTIGEIQGIGQAVE